eukprot:CFRG3839T1
MSLSTLKRRVGRGLSTNVITNNKTGLRSFDAYSKTIDDYTIKTNTGGLVSIISMILVALLFLGELQYYRTTEIRDKLIIDTSLAKKMRIDLDVTMYHLPCSQLGVDVMDVSGESQHEISDSITKQRIAKDGHPLSADINDGASTTAVYGEHRDDRTNGMRHAKLILPTDYCGPCYGAESEERKCCNTCDEARAAINEMGLQTQMNIIQCIREGKEDALNDDSNEGCRVRGFVEAKKVAGNIHIAPGHSSEAGRAHVHDIRHFSVEKFNSSFTVHQLQFGNSYPGLINPLDGTSRVAEKGSTMFQHFLKMVPTVYKTVEGQTIETNQFSYTLHERMVDIANGEGGLPATVRLTFIEDKFFGTLVGVFFNLEVSPIKVVITEKRRSLAHFLTSVCAIVGGVFTVGGFIDATIYRSSKAFRRIKLS